VIRQFQNPIWKREEQKPRKTGEVYRNFDEQCDDSVFIIE